MSLRHIFDAELRHQAGMEPLPFAAEADGELIGSGDGTVTGPGLAGELRWEGHFDADGARASYRAYVQTDGEEGQ